MPLSPICRIRILTLVCFSLLGSCHSPGPTKSEEPLVTFSSDHVFPEKDVPLCKGLLDSYCAYLYSPKALGNLEVKRAQTSIRILQGETPNQLSQVYYRYSLAKIRNQQYLPRDFNDVLQRSQYFEKLKAFLERRPRGSMTLSERLQSEQLDYQLATIWTSSINETIISRMNAKYPDFYKIPDKLVPIELDLERRRIRRDLVSGLSRAIWRNDKNWKKVEQGFSRLQESYVSMIKRLDIEEAIQKDWIQRISEIKLVLPGAMPAISDEECSTTNINAYYYTYLNVLTVCAGDFNSEDILQTLAHEMGHALGVDRSQYLFEVRSQLGQMLATFRQKICQPKVFSCQEWSTFKNQFPNSLQSLSQYQPQLPEFQRCLKRRETSKALSQADVERFSRTLVADRISDLASSDRFLRITKPQVPMRNGKLQKNPNYLNPCSYYLWSQGEEPVDDELSTLMFFTAEYRCTQDKAATERLKDAIEVSKWMTSQIMQSTLKIEGEYSSRSVMETEGYSSPPFERFADVMGSYALSELLAEIPDRRDRQNRFLASSSWQCLEPSIASHYPDESSIEKAYIFDAHTEGDQRRKELFSRPIREVIGCQKDFEFKECEIPFRQPLFQKPVAQTNESVL